MRVTVGDPCSSYVRVYLDGVRVHCAEQADDCEGWVVRVVPSKYVREKVHGKVELRLLDIAPEHARKLYPGLTTEPVATEGND